MFNLLIVDDVKFIRMGIMQYLKDIPDLQIFEAGNAAEAVKVLEENEINLLFLDLDLTKYIDIDIREDLTEKNGLDLVRYMKEMDIKMPHIAILSGTVNETSIRDAYALGITDFVSKPYKMDALKSLITKVKYAN